MPNILNIVLNSIGLTLCSVLMLCFLLGKKKSKAGKLFYFCPQNHYGLFPTKEESENKNLSIPI